MHSKPYTFYFLSKNVFTLHEQKDHRNGWTDRMPPDLNGWNHRLDGIERLERTRRMARMDFKADDQLPILVLGGFDCFPSHDSKTHTIA